MTTTFVLITGLVCVWRTWSLEHSPRQRIFARGKAPSIPLDGFYRGSVPGHRTAWRGKTFDAAQHTGINLFKNKSGAVDKRYRFKTSLGAATRDPGLDVLRIDYNSAGSPFWLHPVLDELVEIAPGHYLGKLHVRVIPGYPFTLAFFELTR